MGVTERARKAEQIAFKQHRVFIHLEQSMTPPRRKWRKGVVRVCKECGAFANYPSDVNHAADCVVLKIQAVIEEFRAFWNGND